MAVPVLTTDYTSLSAFDSTTGLSTWGGNALSKWGLTQDFVREGTYSFALAPKTTGDSGMGITTGSNINLSTNRLYMWINIVSPSFVSSVSSKGVYVRICTSSSSWTSDYNDYYVGGSDVAWVGAGWHLIALDCNRTADASSGTTTLTTIRRVGIGFNIQAAASKSDIICCDQWWYGTYVEATGVTSSSASHSFTTGTNTIARASGSFTTDGFEVGDTVRVDGTASNDGEYTLATVGTTTMTTNESLITESSVTSTVDAGITLESIYTEDGPTQDYWYGIVTKDRNGNYEINGKLIIGDQSGSARTLFVSRGDPVVLADQPLSTSSAEQGIFAVEDTTANTRVLFGESTGTGDNRVGFGGSSVRQDAEYVATMTDGAALGTLDLSVSIDECEVFGTVFQDVNDGISFANNTSHYVTNCIFNNCGQIDLYASEARGLSFLNYSGGVDTGALLWRSSVTNVEQSSFLANTRGIEHTVTGSADYTNLEFAGNTYDVDFSAASGVLTISNLGTSNAASYTTSGTGSVTFVTSKSVDVHIEDSNGVAIEDAVVFIQRDPVTFYTSDTNNNAGDANFTVNEVIDTDQAQTGWIRVWNKASNKTASFRYTSWTSKTLTLMAEITGSVTTAGGAGEENTQLIDSAADFGGTDDVVQGDAIRNTSDGSWALVDQVVSSTELKTSRLTGGSGNQEWDSSDNYSIHRLPITFTDNDDLVEIPLYMKETDSSGDIMTYAHNYSAGVMDIIVRVRYNEGVTKYIPFVTSGSIGPNGYFLTAVLQKDEVAT